MNPEQPSSNDQSGIDYHKGSTMIYGPDGIAFYRAAAIASALRFYAKTGMKINRAYTPTNMFAAATEITGKTFKRGQYLEAAEALTAWAQTMKAALPKTVDGKVVP